MAVVDIALVLGLVAGGAVELENGGVLGHRSAVLLACQSSSPPG
jgi:hypothetical protein